MSSIADRRRARWLTASPRPFWIGIAVVFTGVWFLFGSVDTPFGYDWAIYADGFHRWQDTGSPYQVMTPGWDPCREVPYMYPPSSWPLLVIAAFLPYQFVVLGALPVLWRPPVLALVPLAALLLFVGLGPGLWLANINVIIAGLLVLAFLRGPVGGIALGLAVAIKGYPIVLLPLLWNDRVRLRWFAGVVAGLAVSGTILFGPGAWIDVATTILREGPHCDLSLNPFSALGWWRVFPAVLIVVAGWRLRSPTLTLLGATFITGVVTRHYTPTLTATLEQELQEEKAPPISTSGRVDAS